MRTIFFPLALIAFGINISYGQIWSNPVTGTNPNTANPYTTGDVVIANLTVSGIGRSTAITGANANNRYNANNWALGTTIDLTKYFSFTLTPAAGYEMGFNDLQITLQTSTTGPASFSLRSSADGYSTDITTFTNAGGSTNSINIDLSNTALQNLTTTIVFRLYGWNASGTTGSCSINDFEFNGYVVPVGTVTLNTYYFRSKGSGNWSDAASWEASPDNVIYTVSKSVPDENAAAVFIESNHTITINGGARSSNLTIKNGGTLNHTLNRTLTIYNSTNAYDFVVNGTYVLNGTQTAFISGARCLVNNLVRADDNTTGQSDDFARSTNVDFAGGAVFQWNSTNIFTSGNATYFPNAVPGTTAIFRVTKTTGNIGAAAATTFNGKFEIQGAGVSINFTNAGTKTFRDGFGGNGTITRATTCGAFSITGSAAIIDGSVTINLNKGVSANDLFIPSVASVTISGSPTINVGTASATGAVLNVAGELIHNGSANIALTYGSLIVGGLITGTGSFIGSSINTDISVTRTAAGTAGILRFSTTANTIKSLTMNATGSSGNIALGASLNINNSITLTRGILITGANLLTINNGAVITNPSSPYSSFIATCDAQGNALTEAGLSNSTNTPFAGNVGFRIAGVKGFSYITFPVGPDLVSPNRLAINPQHATGADITVVVGKGDLLETPQPRVNRIWYVHSSNTANVMNSGIRLYFTKFDWNNNNFGTAQDEIENGFIPSAVYVGRKDYTNLEHLTHRSASKDMGTMDGSEDYAEYAFASGMSIPAYYKFGAGNFATIILPLQISSIKAFEQNKKGVIQWSVVNEAGIDKYEVERSFDGQHFSLLSHIVAGENTALTTWYTAFDQFPVSGKNYYRVKAISKDGDKTYSQITSLNINSSKPSVTVLQNPVMQHRLNLQFLNFSAGNAFFYITDINGKIVYQHRIDNNIPANTITTILPDALRGLYFLHIPGSGQLHRFTLLIE